MIVVVKNYKSVLNNKTFFLRDTKYFISNCRDNKDVIKSLKIKPKNIKYSDNIKKELK